MKPKRDKAADTAPASTNGRSPGGEAPAKKRRLRQAAGRTVMGIPVIRRFYVKRIIKFIDKQRAKGKRLSPELMDLERYLARMPKGKRAQALEQAISAEREGETGNRELRRAVAAQQRLSGKRPGGYRPGSPPRSQQGPRPKRPK